ncbi:MAG TPA: ATP-dependent DNA helicase DinG [Porticoccaceae bacterium]|nr:ATP-dependent DNA helicase DinG [Porticoccaceae bacterium]
MGGQTAELARAAFSLVGVSAEDHAGGLCSSSASSAGPWGIEPVLSEELKADIQQAYRAFLENKDFQGRPGQRQMIGRIASFLGALDKENPDAEPALSRVLAVEAGTGTGKTVAYLLSVLPVARALGKKVVVSTGTVALQGQLAERDIPDVLAATGWDYQCVLAKGRGRYLCPLRLQQSQDAMVAQQAGLHLYEDELPLRANADNVATLNTLATALAAGEWDGDRDHWPGKIEDITWQALTVDRGQCLGYRCRHFADCCFFQARAAVDEADCIVANHDLVMSDLHLGGGVILPAPDECIYVFDEAHKLGDTTLNHAASFARLKATGQWLDQIAAVLPQMAEALAGIDGLEETIEQCQDACKLARLPVQQSYPAFEALLLNAANDKPDQYRFTNGLLPEALLPVCGQLSAVFTALQNRFGQLHKLLDRALGDNFCPVPDVDIEQYFQQLGQWLRRAEGVADCWTDLIGGEQAGAPSAKWLTLEEGGDIRVSVSPIIAADRLRNLLWRQAFGVVLTSATLRSLGSFGNFCRDLGLHEVSPAGSGSAGSSEVDMYQVDCQAITTGFDYANAGELVVPELGADGGQPGMHTEAIIRELPALLEQVPQGCDREKGVWGGLVLFSSRRQMDEVAAELGDNLGLQLLVQGDLSVGEVVRRHREAIDSGNRSVIFGLASFAEGMDLPGDYCRHVLIAKLPFAVPDEPIQATLAEWIEARRGNAFAEMSLPQASLRLIQACGRLLRNDTDTGRITILDRRILTKTYGRQLLDALPPFRRVLE